MLQENNIIRDLAKKSNGFIGDDAAVLPNSLLHYIITKDMLIENTHFKTDKITPSDLAHKALHVNLSDLAGMGSKPLYILCGIGIPKRLPQYGLDCLNSLQQACINEGTILIGGDTCCSDRLTISITAIGEANKEQLRYRHNAKAGDIICHIGHLGYAHLGWQAQERNLSTPNEYTQAFHRPTAKTNEGIFLGKHGAVTSLMDVSDGLFLDLQRLCESSKLGAKIELSNIFLKYTFKETALSLGFDPLSAAIVGGEDYGLLFTVNKASLPTLKKDFRGSFDTSILTLGTIEKRGGILYTLDGQPFSPTLTPYNHFGGAAL